MLNPEKCEWNPHKVSDSVTTLRSLEIGDCVRIKHHDLRCSIMLPTGTRDNRNDCQLVQEIKKLNSSGRKLEYYHEEPHVMVVRRLK